MKNIKILELQIGNVFTESLQLKNRESYKVEAIIQESVFATGNNSGRQKEFKTDQRKQVILLKES